MKELSRLRVFVLYRKTQHHRCPAVDDSSCHSQAVPTVEALALLALSFCALKALRFGLLWGFREARAAYLRTTLVCNSAFEAELQQTAQLLQQHPLISLD